jgi:hypothetical protein
MQVPIQTEDVKFLVIFILADTVKRDLNDCSDDIGNRIANGKFKIAVHYAPSLMMSPGQ